MKIKIYRASNAPTNRAISYVFISSNEDIENIKKVIPNVILEKLGTLTFFKEMEINPGEKRIALDADEAINNITNNRYHIQGTEIRFSYSQTKQAP